MLESHDKLYLHGQKNILSSFKCQHFFLVGGFNPFKKYESKWESSPNRGENKTYLSCHHLALDDFFYFFVICQNVASNSSISFFLSGGGEWQCDTADGSEIPNNHLGCIKPCG